MGVVSRKIQKMLVIKTNPTVRPMSGATTMKTMVFGPAGGDDGGEARLCDRGTAVASEQGVRRTRRKPEIPRDEVPENSARQARQDYAVGDHIEVHHALANGLGDGRAKEERRDEIENAAQTTAWPGESTRVDTTVAMELAAS